MLARKQKGKRNRGQWMRTLGDVCCSPTIGSGRFSWNKILGVTVLVGSLLLGCREDYTRDQRVAASPEAPPPPNFYDPEDYNAWLDRYWGRGKSAKDKTLYDGFWRWSLRGAEGLPEPPEDLRTQIKHMVSGPEWRSGQHQELESYIRSVAGPMDVFRRGTESPLLWLPARVDEADACNPLSKTLPWLSCGEYAVCILLVESWRTDAEQSSRMLNAWRRCLQYAAHLESNPLHSVVREGYRARMLCYHAIYSAAATEILADDACRQAISLLAKYPPDPNMVGETVRAEWAAKLGVLQAMYPDGKLSKAVVERIAGLDWKQLKQTGRSPAKNAGEVDTYFSKVASLAAQPLGLDSWRAARELRISEDQGTTKISLVFLNRLRAIAAHRAAGLVLLLQRYRLSHGDWPENLSDLPIDGASDTVIDPFRRGQFAYKLGDHIPNLYSVAGDGVDDGGRPGNWDYRSLPRRNADFCFWPPK